ncbi:MAG: hypothetical protein WC683_04120 [bacterium]
MSREAARFFDTTVSWLIYSRRLADGKLKSRFGEALNEMRRLLHESQR